MKKLVAILMVATMLLSLGVLASCGSSAPAASPSASAAPPASASAEPSAAITASEAPKAEVEKLEITFNSTYQEKETGGLVVQYFIDQLKDMSDGNITVNLFTGGTVYDPMTQLDALREGAVNMISFGHMPMVDTVPYLSFPGFAPVSAQNAVDYFSNLMFDNAETAKPIQDEAASVGIKYLNVLAGGANVFVTNYEFKDLDSLVKGSKSFGNMDAVAFQTLGLQVSAVLPWDVYDGLQRGLIDSTQMALAPAVAMAWYEVGKYWMLDQTFSAGQFYTVNLDWWNSLTDAQRDVIQQAADLAETYSIDMLNKEDAANLDKVKSNGGTLVEMSAADAEKWWGVIFDAKAADALMRAETNKKTEGMTTILEAAAEFTKYSWQH